VRKRDVAAEVELLARHPPVVICAFAISARVRSCNDVALHARPVRRAALSTPRTFVEVLEDLLAPRRL